MEQGIFVIAFGQVVVGNLCTQVMDVMKTDVSTEPLQDERQLIEGTALQTRFYEFPAFVVVPVRSGQNCAGRRTARSRSLN